MSKPEQREEEVFEAAIRLPADQRAAYLDQTCADDPETRRRIEALLGAFERAGGFLKQPVMPSSPRTLVVSLTPTEKPGDRIGRYKLLQEIGAGGCGVVYMAEQEEPVRRRVALKVIKLGMDTKEVIARFEAERQALALMDHPNIAKVLDAGATDAGRPYFVMELVRGIKITDFCDENKLSTQERLKLFIQVCQAIQHAHQKGIIHRDIKPSNILVTTNDGVPLPKVIDFGIAKATAGRLTDQSLFTAFEQFIGTPAYMSPEQAVMTSLDIDTRSDIYSLGVLLYELLTGKTPFDARELLQAGLDAMRRTIREVEPVKPSTRLTLDRMAAHSAASGQPQIRNPKSEINQDLDWIAMKCLEKDRMRRYETASGLAADITRHLNDEPVVARPPSRIYQFQKMVRRHKFGFAAAAAIILTLAGGITLTMLQAVRAARAESKQSVLREVAEKAQQTAQIEASRAEAADLDSKRTMSTSDFLKAVRLIAEDNAIDALLYLARSLSANPSNNAALMRLTTLLTYRTWRLPTMTLKHEKQINSAEFSTDGKRILTTSADGTARLWDAMSGQALVEPMKHPFSVTSAQFSPNQRRLVTISDDLTIRVWDAETGQPVTAPMKHTNLVTSVRFSPDGKRLVSNSGTNTTRAWDAETGEALTEPVAQDQDMAKDTGNVSGTNVYSLNMVGYVNGQVASYTNGPNGWQQINEPNEPAPTAFVDGPARVWNVLTTSPDGERVLTVSGRTAYLWERRTASPLALRPPVSLTSDRPQFSHDGKRILTVSQDGSAHLWDAETGRPLTEPMKHGDQVKAARVSLDGKRIVTASDDDDIVRVWDAETGQILTDSIKHEGALYSIEFSPDGKQIVTASADDTARVWDAQTGRALTAPIKQDREGVRAAQFSPDGKRIVTVSGTGTVRFWDAQTGQSVAEPIRPGGVVSAVEFSPDGKRILTASTDGTARVWDAQTGQPRTEPIQHDVGGVKAARFSPDGKQIVTASGDKTARVWDATTGHPLTHPIKHESDVQTAQFSPDGRHIVTVSGQTARVWDVQTAQPLTDPLPHGGGRVPTAQFSPDGKRILTASEGSPPHVWDIAPTGPCPNWLLQLVEVFSGTVLNKEGVLEPTRLNRVETLDQIRQQLAAQPEDDWVVWGRWLLADRTTRTISPVAKLTVPEYFERLLKDKSRQFLAEAEQLGAEKPDILPRISKAREALDNILQVRGQESAKLPSAMRRLAEVQKARGKPQDAEKLYEEIVQSARQAFGDSHPALGELLNDFGRFLYGESKWHASAERYIQSLPIRRTKQNDSLAWTLRDLGGVLVGARRPADAERYLRESLDLYRMLHKNEDINGTAYTAEKLGEALSEQRKFPEAAQAYREALVAYSKIQGIGGMGYTRTAQSSIRALNSANKPAEVEELLIDLLAQLRQAPDTNQNRAILALLPSLTDSARSLLEKEEFARAELLARECVAGHEKLLEESWFKFDSQSMLGGCLLGQKQYAAAEPLLLSGYEGMKEREAAIPLSGKPRLKEALQRLVKFSNETGRDSQAAEWREKLAAFAKTEPLPPFGIPPRASQTPPNLIDLSAFYNGGFMRNWLNGYKDSQNDESKNDLAYLPVGVQELAGTQFDVRGLIQLSRATWNQPVVEQVTGVPTPGKCRRVHFLHGALGGRVTTDTVIGHFVFHYADGTTQERPLVSGKDVRDWWSVPPKTAAQDGLVVAWKGQNSKSRPQGLSIYLYKTTWENPTPEIEITSIDFISAKKASAPFLVAITVE